MGLMNNSQPFSLETYRRILSNRGKLRRRKSSTRTYKVR